MTQCTITLHAFALVRTGCVRGRLWLFNSNKEECGMGCGRGERTKVVCKGFVRDVYENTFLAILHKPCVYIWSTLRTASRASKHLRG